MYNNQGGSQQLADVIKMYNDAKQMKVASQNSSQDSSISKIASEAGVRGTEQMAKIAAVIGDAIGNQAYDTFHSRMAESFGFDPEVVKTAGLQDLLFGSVVKIAEQITGNVASGYESETGAEATNVGEQAAHHANLAAQAATEVIQALDQDDTLTAVQQLSTAKNAIEVAQQHAARISNPVVHQQIQEASGLVAHAASAAEQHALGGVVGGE